MYQQQQPPYQPPQQPAPKRNAAKGCAFLGCGGLAAVVIAVALIASHGSGSGSGSGGDATPSAGQQAQEAAPAASTAPAAAKTVATFSGSGIENTPKFTVTGTWKLDYSFDCSSFGYKGNFIADTDGGSDFNGASVNELAMSKSGSTMAYNDAGTHYLAVNSECSWTVKVIDEGD